MSRIGCCCARAACALASAVLLLAASGSVAAAEGGVWGWPCGKASSPVLGFGATYTENGSTRVHHGVDLKARAGEQVESCAAGVVVFVGRVPADGGGTVLAVTVKDSADRRVTYLPLAVASVSRDEQVAAGARVGSLAAAGDGSHAESHLHLGVRVGETYVDPVPFLPRADPAPSPAGEPAPEAARPTAPAPKPAAAGDGVQVPAPELAPNPASSARGGADAPGTSARGLEAATPRTASFAARTAARAPSAGRVPVGEAARASGASGVLGALCALAERARDTRGRAERVVLSAIVGVLGAAFMRPVWRRASRPRGEPALARARE